MVSIGLSYPLVEELWGHDASPCLPLLSELVGDGARTLFLPVITVTPSHEPSHTQAREEVETTGVLSLEKCRLTF